VLKLDGSTGVELWGAGLPSPYGGSALALAFDPIGNVVAAGYDISPVTAVSQRFLVAKLSGKSAGKRLVVTDSAANTSRRRLTLNAVDRGLFTATPGSASDPTLVGDTLELSNPATSESVAISLPPRNWLGLGVPIGTLGYRCSDRAQAAGPCRRVEIRQDSRLLPSCDGSLLGFTLDEPSQGSLVVRLTTGDLTTCTRFGGTVAHDTPVTGNTRGLFQAKNAPAVANCP
jgi:hypothetical protein